VGRSSLWGSSARELPPPDPGNYNFASECLMHFSMRVPQTSFYQFGIDGHGSVTESLAKMKRTHWRVGFDLSQ
jgi:hypothetical protein